MGRGLKIAAAAARATNTAPPLDREMTIFLEAIHLSGGRASRGRVRMPVASREQDAARKKCKRFGLAFYHDGEWHITKAGKDAIDAN